MAAKPVRPRKTTEKGRPPSVDKVTAPNVVKDRAAAVKLTDELIDKMCKLCVLGCNDSEIAQFFGIVPETFSKWKQTVPGFRQTLANARIMSLADVAQAAFKAAVGYTRKEIKIVAHKGDYVLVPIEVEVGPDPNAALKILAARAGQVWNPDKGAAPSLAAEEEDKPTEKAAKTGAYVYIPSNGREENS